jgi:hypothetical protein
MTKQVCAECGQAFRVVRDVSGRGLLVIGCGCGEEQDRLWSDMLLDMRDALHTDERALLGEDRHVYVVAVKA